MQVCLAHAQRTGTGALSQYGSVSRDLRLVIGRGRKGAAIRLLKVDRVGVAEVGFEGDECSSRA